MHDNDDQIIGAYERLDGALAPPLDAPQRVERRIAARRRHRRTALAGVAAAGVVAVGGTVVALAGGSAGTGPAVATDPGSEPVSTLVLTRPDGSTYAFDDVTVTCEQPYDEVGGSGERIWMTSPRTIKDKHLVEPFVYFDGIVAELQGEPTLELPVWDPGDSRTYPLTLFVADPVDDNEAASSAGGSGTVRVLRAACDPVPVLELEVDAVLGSEVEKDSLRVTGQLR